MTTLSSSRNLRFLLDGRGLDSPFRLFRWRPIRLSGFTEKGQARYTFQEGCPGFVAISEPGKPTLIALILSQDLDLATCTVRIQTQRSIEVQFSVDPTGDWFREWERQYEAYRLAKEIALLWPSVEERPWPVRELALLMSRASSDFYTYKAALDTLTSASESETDVSPQS